MKKATDVLMFGFIFFSFAFIFSINISGINIPYNYIVFIILGALTLAITISSRVSIRRKYFKFVVIYFLFLMSSTLSYFFMNDYSVYATEQFIKGLTVICINFSMLLIVVLYLNLDKQNIYKYVIYIKKTLKLMILYGFLQLITFPLGIYLNEILVNIVNLPERNVMNRYGSFFRVTSFTWDTNYFAFMILLYIFFVLYFYDIKPIVRTGDRIIAVLSVGVLIFTFSRSSFLGFFVILLMLISDVRKKKIRRNLYLMFISIGGVLLIMYRNLEVFSPIIFDRLRFLSQGDGDYLRRSFFNIAMDLIATNPFGIGINNLSNYAMIEFGNNYFKLHNTFLQIAVENGLISLMIFMVFLSNLVFSNRYKVKQKIFFLSMLFITNMFYDQLLSIFSMLYMFIFLFDPLKDKVLDGGKKPGIYHNK